MSDGNIPDFQALRRVDLGPQHHASRTRHTLWDKDGDRSFPPFVSLEIASYREDKGCYLLHICGDGIGTDTWHETIEQAMDQAEWEFGVTPEEWMVAAENVGPGEPK
jgi:hypothetical protein